MKCQSRMTKPASLLQADPEQMPHPRREIEGSYVAGHAQQVSTNPGHDILDDHHHEEDLGGDARGRSRDDLGGQDRRDPGAVEFEHITPHGRRFGRALDIELVLDPGAVMAGGCGVRGVPETGPDQWRERDPRKLFSRRPGRNPSVGRAR
jgi:hypothetical protein